MSNTSLPVILVIENVRSAHNVGALFRTAEAAGIEKIILGPLCPIPPRPEIEKTALGTTDGVPWEQEPNLLLVLQQLKQKGYHMYALEQTATSLDLFQTAVSFPLVLIVGHEREGVSSELLALAEKHLHLPMRGTRAHSLNVSTAGGIGLYELGRRFWYD